MGKLTRRKSSGTLPPYSANPNIEVEYEYQFGKKTVVPGDIVRFKFARGTFVFLHFARNTVKEVEWIDCIDTATKEYRSFRPENLKKVEKKPEPRTKRTN